MRGVVVTLTLLLTSLATVAAVSATGSTEKAVANKGIVWRLASDSLLTITRLQYEGGGDWYANPSSLPNLLLAIRMRTGLSVSS